MGIKGIKSILATTTVAAMAVAGSALAENDPHLDVETELQGAFYTQLAASDGKCYVDRIRKQWQDAGEPKVKGWAEEVSDAEAEAAYQCVIDKINAIYSKVEGIEASAYQGWKKYNNNAYTSGTHGGRFVNSYANETGNAYGKFEDAGVMPVGTVLAKDSFGVNKKGEVKVGPLFTMTKMDAGFNADSADWEYALYTPKGKLMGATNGDNSKKVKFCIGCHVGAEDFDQMFFMPDEYRVQ